MKISIDVIIPSFRLNPAFILPLFNLPQPEFADITFYLIADDPSAKIDDSIIEKIDHHKRRLLINPKNIGLCATRNEGMAASHGDWILFLDDDILADEQLLVHYANAIKAHPGAIGFMGPVNFPPPQNNFHRALLDAGMLNSFNNAARQQRLATGVGANMMISKKAVGNLRFSNDFSNWGGGDEVDFLLALRDKWQSDYFAVPNAKVVHPWWNNGAPQHQRFFRYATGNALLPVRFPKFRYYDFPNITEINTLTLILLAVGFFIHAIFVFKVFVFLIVSVLFELLFTWIDNILVNKNKSVAVAIQIFLVKYANYAGACYGNWVMYKRPVILERFNFSGKANRNFQLNRRKITRGIFYILFIIGLVLFTRV